METSFDEILILLICLGGLLTLFSAVMYVLERGLGTERLDD